LRKLAAVVVFLTVLATPSVIMAQPRWYRGDAPEVTVYIERTRVGATNWAYVRGTGYEWARSARIRVMFVKRCPSRFSCVKVYEGRSSRNQAGWTTLNYDRETDDAWYGTVHLNTRYLTSAATRRKTACHELGHVVGLEHRRSGTTCMRDGFATLHGHPDGTDDATLRRIYATA
jgi:hypothetical protein